MSLTESSYIDHTIIDKDGHIFLRVVDIILRDGIEVEGTRRLRDVHLPPGADLSSVSDLNLDLAKAEAATVTAVAQAVWTPERIDSYNQVVSARQAAFAVQLQQLTEAQLPA
jgi:hypothetical protein